ncbi:hypothetical protein DFH29DRAFT_932258 [Suillus ampliporus]|nr:hypothetical protein DFH29DRAFT_932258 [Suillus ampliporus]
MLWSISRSFWTSVRSAILTMQQLFPTSRGPALKAIFPRTFKTLTLLPLYSATPLHCIHRATSIIPNLYITSPQC